MKKHFSNRNIQSPQHDFLTGEFMRRCAMKLDAKNKAIEFMIENYVRHNAVPEIKGKITKGKIRWRGIKIETGSDYEYTVFRQRGKVISPYLNHETLELTDEQPMGIGWCPPFYEIYGNAYSSALSESGNIDKMIEGVIEQLKTQIHD